MRQTGAQLHCQYRADLCGLIAADPDLATHQNLFWYRGHALHVAVLQHVDAQLLIPLTSFLEHADDLVTAGEGRSHAERGVGIEGRTAEFLTQWCRNDNRRGQ